MAPRRTWLTAAEVASMFEVTNQSVRLWILTGQLEGEQSNEGLWLVHESAIERFRAQRHAANTLPHARGGELSSRSTIRTSDRRAGKPIDPAKRYRIKGTGELVSGAELLRRRGVA